MITNFKPVTPGTDGGISLFGTIAALLGAASVAVAAVATGLVPVKPDCDDHSGRLFRHHNR